jgi:FMN phosphatase YigB (HAD superfamily)
VEWGDVRFVGFDLDGTLYDEFDFISQAYQPISKRLALVTGGSESDVYECLLRRWLEKGSSYNRIFSDVLQDAGVTGASASVVVDDCLTLFRKFTPHLSLSNRTTLLLDFFIGHYQLFLVTDGSCALQQAKFNSLGLGRWFDSGNVVVSGCAGKNYEKPSRAILEKIRVLDGERWTKCDAVYFGDRDVDCSFADASDFQYVPVRSMFYVHR